MNLGQANRRFANTRTLTNCEIQEKAEQLLITAYCIMLLAKHNPLQSLHDLTRNDLFDTIDCFNSISHDFIDSRFSNLKRNKRTTFILSFILCRFEIANQKLTVRFNHLGRSKKEDFESFIRIISGLTDSQLELVNPGASKSEYKFESG